MPHTILMVEDNALNLSVFRAVLDRAGYVVLDAATGEQAMRRAAEHGGSIDLLITDVVLDRECGIDVAAAVARSRPGLRCLFISGYTEDELKYRGLLRNNARCGEVFFLQKPFLPRDLLAKVAALINPDARQRNTS